MQDLRVLSILGVGTFGRVKLVLHTTDNDRPYALKCMRKGQVVALKQVEHVMNEKKVCVRTRLLHHKCKYAMLVSHIWLLQLLEVCDHPFLLRLAATYQDDDEIYMLLELALGGEVSSTRNLLCVPPPTLHAFLCSFSLSCANGRNSRNPSRVSTQPAYSLHSRICTTSPSSTGI